MNNDMEFLLEDDLITILRARGKIYVIVGFEGEKNLYELESNMEALQFLDEYLPILPITVDELHSLFNVDTPEEIAKMMKMGLKSENQNTEKAPIATNLTFQEAIEKIKNLK